jgi:hypothetical protein
MIANNTHWGRLRTRTEEHGYKTIVISGPIQGNDNLSFGRLLQVRKKSGAFGSDTIFLREADGKVRCYHNMAFFDVASEFLPMFEEAMKEVDEKNIDNEESVYSISGKNPAIGFVIEGYDDVNFTMPLDAKRELELKKIL